MSPIPAASEPNSAPITANPASQPISAPRQARASGPQAQRGPGGPGLAGTMPMLKSRLGNSRKATPQRITAATSSIGSTHQ
jgi:hypothetical protein